MTRPKPIGHESPLFEWQAPLARAGDPNPSNDLPSEGESVNKQEIWIMSETDLDELQRRLDDAAKDAWRLIGPVQGVYSVELEKVHYIATMVIESEES